MDANYFCPELPTMPLLPNLTFSQQDVFKYNHNEQERPPLLRLGPMLPSFLCFPRNQRKMLENTMLRTGSESSNLLKKKSKMDI